MKILGTMADMIDGELKQAECYVNEALDNQEEYPDVSNDYISLAQGNLDRVNALHNRSTKLIEAERKEHGDPPESMLKVYEYLHRKHIERAADVRRIINEMR